jgi:hypothetical protein
MSLESIKQNAKAFLDVVYTFDRQKIQKADKKDIEKTQSYMKKILEDIKKNVDEERKNI